MTEIDPKRWRELLIERADRCAKMARVAPDNALSLVQDCAWQVIKTPSHNRFPWKWAYRELRHMIRWAVWNIQDRIWPPSEVEDGD